MGTFLDFPKLAAVLDDAYADLFGIAPYVENESSPCGGLGLVCRTPGLRGQQGPETSNAQWPPSTHDTGPYWQVKESYHDSRRAECK